MKNTLTYGPAVIAAIALTVAVISLTTGPSASDITKAKDDAISTMTTSLDDSASALREFTQATGKNLANGINTVLKNYVSTTDIFGNTADRPQYIATIKHWYDIDSTGAWYLDSEGLDNPETTWVAVPIYHLMAAAGRPIQTVLAKGDTLFNEDSSWVELSYSYNLPAPGTVVTSAIAQVQPTAPAPQVKQAVAVKDTTTTKKKQVKETLPDIF